MSNIKNKGKVLLNGKNKKESSKKYRETVDGKRIIPLREQPFTNHFVFEMSMMQGKLCKLFLGEVLGKKIKRIEFIEREKDIKWHT